MASIQLRTARTEIPDTHAAVEHLLSTLSGPAPGLVTLFAPRSRDHQALNKALRERLPKTTRLIGCTSAAEIDREGFHTGSVMLGALTGDFEVGIGLGKNLSMDAVSAGAAAIDQACSELGTRVQDLDTKQNVGVVIDDGFRYKKEEFLLAMTERNQGLVLVGGGASDAEQDPEKQSALIHVDGEVVTDAVLLTMFKTRAPWGALRSHWYLPTGQTLRITKVDDTCKRALEIDGKPAAQRYADLLGVTVDDLEFGKPKGFATAPTALRVGREYFIRAPWKPLPDGSILFANLLDEGTELELMKIGDMIQATRRFFEEEVPRRVANPRAALVFHCSGRSWFADSTGNRDALGATFGASPANVVGLNVYFETYCGFHINTTLTTLVFGEGA